MEKSMAFIVPVIKTKCIRLYSYIHHLGETCKTINCVEAS